MNIMKSRTVFLTLDQPLQINCIDQHTITSYRGYVVSINEQFGF